MTFLGILLFWETPSLPNISFHMRTPRLSFKFSSRIFLSGWGWVGGTKRNWNWRALFNISPSLFIFMHNSEVRFCKLLSHIQPTLQQKDINHCRAWQRWGKKAAKQHNHQAKPVEEAQTPRRSACLDPERANRKHRAQRSANTWNGKQAARRESLISHIFMICNRKRCVRGGQQCPSSQQWLSEDKSSCSWRAQQRWLCSGLPLLWLLTRHSCSPLLPAAFEPPAATSSFLPAIYIFFLICPVSCLPLWKGRWNWNSFKPDFLRKQVLWHPLGLAGRFLTSPSSTFETEEVTLKIVSSSKLKKMDK